MGVIFTSRNDYEGMKLAFRLVTPIKLQTRKNIFENLIQF